MKTCKLWSHMEVCAQMWTSAEMDIRQLKQNSILHNMRSLEVAKYGHGFVLSCDTLVA